ncbi:MAG: hypothetical protein H6765_07335 [Candidatus Peribacteria bacterium]|nr:MAG: hypothetical protein H6765_07335 [Candidatus Peribacteria bacterium]
MLAEQQEIEEWLAAFRKLDHITHTADMLKQLPTSLKKMKRLSQIEESHIPKVLGMIQKLQVGMILPEDRKSYIFEILNRFGISYDIAQATDFYTVGDGETRIRS